MFIKLSDSKKVSEIQSEFNLVFPYLKIEFFEKPHGKGGASPKRQMIASDKLLKAIHPNRLNGQLEVLETQTVAEVEKAFLELFELNIQIFRKSGNLWLETTVTDDWTLKQQNDQGRELSSMGKD